MIMALDLALINKKQSVTKKECLVVSHAVCYGIRYTVSMGYIHKHKKVGQTKPFKCLLAYFRLVKEDKCQYMKMKAKLWKIKLKNFPLFLIIMDYE